MVMKKMMKGWLAVAALTVSCSVLAQQPRRSPQERADRQFTWMQKNLSLTEEQGKKVHDILLYYARENDKNAMDNPPGPDRKAERQGINKGKDEELRAVLTGEQYARYHQHMQEMKARMQERRAGMQEGY